MKEKRRVFHSIRDNDRIFLCISDIGRKGGAALDLLNMSLKKARELSNKSYSVEREIIIDPEPTKEYVKSLIAEMEQESGFDLEPSQDLKEFLEM